MSSKNGEIFQISKLSLFRNMTQKKYQMLLESSGILCYLCKDGLLNMKITCFALSLEELNCLHPMNYIKFAARLWLWNKEICLEFHDAPHVTVTNPQPFVFTVFRMSFYDNPMPLFKCYTHIFCFLKIIIEQIIRSALCTKESSSIKGCRNRFHFHIKQQANITRL